MRTAVTLGFITLAGIAFSAHALRGQQPPPGQPAAPRAANGAAGPLRELYQDRLKAARDVVSALERRLEAGEAMTPTMVALQSEAYRRVAEAEAAAAGDNAGRIAAAGQYVRRCEQVLKIVEARHKAGLDVSNVQVAQAQYHLADAKVMLAEALGKE